MERPQLLWDTVLLVYQLSEKPSEEFLPHLLLLHVTAVEHGDTSVGGIRVEKIYHNGRHETLSCAGDAWAEKIER
jgi:hypothetical protein